MRLISTPLCGINSRRVPVWSVSRALACVTLFTLLHPAHAATAPNANSPMGTNLAPPNQWGTENPFLNLMNCEISWTTSNATTWDTGEESSLQLDANGYPTSLVANPVSPGGQKFTYVLVALNCGAPSGQYTVNYQGAGTLVFRLGASVVSSRPDNLLSTTILIMGL